jgi:hypothetical protein
MHMETRADLPPNPTLKQAAEFIGVDIKTVRRWIEIAALPRIALGHA